MQMPVLYQSFWSLGFDDHCCFGITISILAVWTTVILAVVLIDLTLSWNKDQLPADIFLSDQFHPGSTDRTDLFIR